MSREQQMMLQRLQQIGLAVVDMALYLDTHPFDTMAQTHFNIAVNDYDEQLAEYTEQYGALTLGSIIPAGSEGFPWALTPFPWDM